jgi:hypothetical protein
VLESDNLTMSSNMKGNDVESLQRYSIEYDLKNGMSTEYEVLKTSPVKYSF